MQSGEAGDKGKNNYWENNIRPANTNNRTGGMEPSAMIVDMFPMADGKLPSSASTYNKLEKSSFEYDRNYPFMNRDPRFYRTFAFPGVRWAYNGDASQGGVNNNPKDGANYALWNYVWYTNQDDAGNVESGEAYGADNLLKTKGSLRQKAHKRLRPRFIALCIQQWILSWRICQKRFAIHRDPLRRSSPQLR